MGRPEGLTGPDRRSIRQDGLGGAGAFFLAFVRFARWRAAAAAMLIVLGALFEGMGLLLLVPVLELMTGQAGGGRILGPLLERLHRLGGGERLMVLLGVFAALMVGRGVALAARDRALARLQLEFVERTRAGLVQALAGANWQTVSRLNHARLVQALSVEIHQVGVAANSGLLAAAALAMLAGHCALALILAPLAGPVTIVFAVLGALISRPYVQRARSLGRAITEAHFGMAESAMSFLGGLKLASAQGLQDRFVGEYRAISLAAMADRLTFLALQSRLRNIIAGLAALVGVATLLAGLAVFHLEPSVLITLLLILSRMSAPALLVQQGAQQMLHSLPSYGVIRSLQAELGPTPAPRADPSGDGRSSGPIVFSRVGFSHPSSGQTDAALRDVSLVIPEGAFVGIVGPSGAGKTTFLDLLTGVLTPQSGRIYVAGRELAGAALVRHRADLAYVAQDPFLFDDTIRRNLCWARPDCPEPELRRAIAFVGASDLVGRLEAGLDTRIGERGVLLSAGERQRLALARAILRRPRLLILDEATNAIDIAGERPILAALASLRPRTTIVMVAHRPESLALCDHILEFPGARLAAAPALRARPVA